MENREFIGRLGYWIIGIWGVIAFPNFVSAYSLPTHRHLTAAAIELYNQHFPDNKISKKLAGSLLEGSEREDDPPRWLNHFYDPLYDRGLTLLSVSFMKSKEWAGHRDNFQSWQRGLAFFQKGEKQKAGLALGHVLHLLQDMAVPDHVRNDLHPDDSPYETFVRGLKPKNFDKKEPIALDNLELYFKDLADYSHKNFYSKDSIDLVEYPLPKPDFFAKETDYDYGIKQDEEFGDYFLVKEEKNKKEGGNHLLVRKSGSLLFKDLALSIDDPKILKDYWERLSVKAIQYGAGLLHLFFQEAAAGPVTVEGPEPEDLLARTLGMANLLAVFRGGGEQSLKLEEVVDLKEEETNLEDLDFNINNKERTGTDVILGAARSKTIPVKPKDCQFAAVFPAGETAAAVINEIAWMGSKNNANHEWLELKNIRPSQLNIGGWWLLSQDGRMKINLPADAVIPAGGYYLLERADDGAVPQVRADHVFKGALNNKGEYLRLVNADCRLMDEIDASAGWPAGDAEEKRTMERKEDRSWQSFLWSDLPHILGTPKMANSFGQPAIIPGSAQGGGTSTDSMVSSPPPPPPSPTPAPPPASGGETSAGQTPAKVVKINEFLFDADGNDKDKEFIELYNESDAVLDISGWSIQTPAAKKNFEAGDKIAAKSFFLIWLGAHPFSDMEWASGLLKNSSSTIYLVRRQQKIEDAADPEIEDKVDYDVNNLAGFSPGMSWERDFSTGAGRVQSTPNPQSSQGPAAVYFYNHPLSGQPVIELRWSGGYPLTPAYYRPDGPGWDILVFYLNPDPLNLGSRLPLFLSTPDHWEPPDKTGVVKVLYPDYTGSEGAGDFSLILPDEPGGFGNGGGILNSALHLGQIEDKNLVIKTVGLPALNENDYLQAAYYDFLRSGGGEQRFQLLAMDGRRYFFGQPPVNSPPQINGALSINFNQTASRLEIDWPAASDGDDLDRDLNYEINFGGGWQNLTGNQYQRQINLGESFTVNVRASDKINFSGELTGSWQSAADVLSLQPETGGWGTYFGYRNEALPLETPLLTAQVIAAPSDFIFNRAALRLEQSAPLGADAGRLRLKIFQRETETGISDVGWLANTDPNLDVIFSFSDPINFTAGEDYKLQLEAVEYADPRGFFRNSWRNAVNPSGRWYLRLGHD